MRCATRQLCAARAGQREADQATKRCVTRQVYHPFHAGAVLQGCVAPTFWFGQPSAVGRTTKWYRALIGL
eukprot:1159566-Pelagomonas_calceolata.AAC.9